MAESNTDQINHCCSKYKNMHDISLQSGKSLPENSIQKEINRDCFFFSLNP